MARNEWTAQSDIYRVRGRRFCKSRLEFEFAVTFGPSDGRRKFAVIFSKDNTKSDSLHIAQFYALEGYKWVLTVYF